MKIKKFVAPDIRRAIRMVREEQGPDAVILSNRRVDGGVEIVSAIDYDEALFNTGRTIPYEQNDYAKTVSEDFPAEQQNRHADNGPVQVDQTNSLNPPKEQSPIQESLLAEMRAELNYLRNIVETRFFDMEWINYSHSNPASAELIKRLLSCGFSSKLARDLAKDLPLTNKIEDAWEKALIRLADQVLIAEDDIIDKGGIVALVGPTGVGKTTTVAKLAARYALRRGVRHVGLITTDYYRVGAHEQLRTYGRLLDIPVRNASNKDELKAQIDDLMDKDLVLIDTAGMSQRDMRISEQLSVLKESKANIRVYLVINAIGQLSGIEEVINVFRGIDLDGCILTKVDEATSIGPAISAIIEQKLPIAYISDGQRVPEDLHLARADKIVNKENFSMRKTEEKADEDMMHFMMGRTAKNAH
jgi:flagellar biosynthesis protein FlhF